MKKYLIQKEGTFYKANLHSHSTMSDGRLTPRELKDAYKERGYAVLAITDHEIMFDHSDLNDEEFLTLTSCEIAINQKGPYWPVNKVCHINVYSCDPHDTTQIMYDPSMLVFSNAQYADQVRYTGGTVTREYTPEHINAVIRAANERGYLVSYNHPAWSLEDYRDYSQYEGMFAMEIYNTCCAVSAGMNEHNERVYDEMLRDGKRIFCTATDDCHSEAPLGAGKNDSFGGWVMIKADSLDYKTVFSALRNGQFYASCGPVIHSLFIEDNTAVIECEPARSIRFGTYGRTACVIQNEDGSSVTAARIPLNKKDVFFRFEVQDEMGRKAYTNAYFMDSIPVE